MLFIVIYYSNYKYKPTLRNFRQADISIKSVDFVSVLCRPWGDRPGSSPLNPALVLVTKYLYVSFESQNKHSLFLYAELTIDLCH
jgi:hypothetical protein